MTFSVCADGLRAKSGKLLYSICLILGLVGSVPAQAQQAPLDKQIKRISDALNDQEARLAAQERLLRTQQDAIAKQAEVIESQRAELARLQAKPVRVASDAAPEPAVPETKGRSAAVPPASLPWTALQEMKARPVALTFPESESRPARFAQSDSTTTRRTSSTPTSPVGEAPVPDQSPEVVQSLPEGLAVLTPAEHFILTPSLEYTHTNNDRLVFRGVVIVPGINLGQIEASRDDRNIVSAVADLRYGINSRLELEARVPFTFSDDRATVLAQNLSGSTTQSMYLHNSGIGDIELGARYQINDGREEWPIFVANGRVKTNTGIGPFDVQRDASGIAQQVALGSGFVGLEGGFSMLKLSDPVVLYASANYMYQLPKDINQTIGNVFVGRVEPGNSITGNMGFGFAVNPDFSFSLGYEHSYVFPQFSMIGSTRQESNSLQVGALTLGMAYHLAPNLSLNGNFEFGTTSDAPDVRAVFSLPITF
jgi:uncharacterized coiled-coil protein SlyX